MEQTTGNGRDDRQQVGEHLRRTAEEERHRSERLANQLSRECMQFHAEAQGPGRSARENSAG